MDRCATTSCRLFSFRFNEIRQGFIRNRSWKLKMNYVLLCLRLDRDNSGRIVDKSKQGQLVQQQHTENRCLWTARRRNGRANRLDSPPLIVLCLGDQTNEVTCVGKEGALLEKILGQAEALVDLLCAAENRENKEDYGNSSLVAGQLRLLGSLCHCQSRLTLNKQANRNVWLLFQPLLIHALASSQDPVPEHYEARIQSNVYPSHNTTMNKTTKAIKEDTRSATNLHIKGVREIGFLSSPSGKVGHLCNCSFR